MPRPACIRCKHPTVEKGYFKRQRMCAACFRLSQLESYDDAVAERRVQELYRASDQFDKVVTAMKRTMRPPPGAPEWKLHHVVELDSRRMNWGRGAA